MAKNTNLNKAKDAKYDEFYTKYEDIQEELNHYISHFENKTVFCNCDDPFESNFCKFFLKNFNYLKLKRLICTSYTGSPVIATQISLFDDFEEPISNNYGYVMDIREVPMKNGRGVSDEDIETLLHSKKRGVKKLKGNGDFRSDECIEYLKQADIVVTNPPFSLFREYVAQLMKYEKKFLIIGSINGMKYKEIFPFIKNEKIWLGFATGAKSYRVPGKYEGKTYEENGIRYAKMGNTYWYTNLDHSKRHEPIILYAKYNSENYAKYYNFDGIHIENVSEIPKDYDGNMGVPLSYLEKHNPDQFEIIGLGRDGFGITVDRSIYEKIKLKNPNARPSHLGYYLENGYPKEPYDRIIIKNKKPEKGD